MPTDPDLNDRSKKEIERLCAHNLLASEDERIYFKDREGRFLVVSAGMAAVFRRNRPGKNTVIGMTDADFSSAQHHAAAMANAQRVIDSGQSSLEEVQSETHDNRPDVWARTSRLPLRDDEGNIIGTWGTTRDITEEVHAERALAASRRELQASERRHNTLFENNPQPTFLCDRTTLALVAVNRAVETVYGYSRTELLEMTLQDLMPEGDTATSQVWHAGADIEGVQPAQAARLRYKDGSIADVEVTGNDVTLDGRACRVVSTADVTQRNRVADELAAARDAAVEASNVKSTFLANVSHEIRTPMNGVIGLAELLLDSELSEEQRALADEVSRSGQLMVELMNGILDLSKLEAARVELEVADFPLRETIEQACAVAALQARSAGLEFDLQIADGVPAHARGDALRLRQVLANLLSNAGKFTSEGRVAVHVTVPPRRSAAVYRIEVTDTGIGIEPDAIERVFDPFTQADSSTTRRYGGTGLGLAIVRELADLMGGHVGVNSELGAGSTFWIELPLTEAASEGTRPAPSPKPRVSSAVWSTAPSILVVEDSPVNQLVAVRTLERCGCDVEAVGSGEEALDAVERTRYDAILMDCQMPGIDGFQTTVELRRRERGERRVPVLAMTAHAIEDVLDSCKEAGMDGYIGKPINREQMMDTLKTWLADLVSGHVNRALAMNDALASTYYTQIPRAT